jgi:F-type H+-transporting ATPase subunit b
LRLEDFQTTDRLQSEPQVKDYLQEIVAEEKQAHEALEAAQSQARQENATAQAEAAELVEKTRAAAQREAEELLAAVKAQAEREKEAAIQNARDKQAKVLENNRIKIKTAAEKLWQLVLKGDFGSR